MRQLTVAGNWKMNAAQKSSAELVRGILQGMTNLGTKIIVCPPFPYLQQISELSAKTALALGAQNLNINEKGAFTGEVAASMIKDFGAEYVIVGHSERRGLYGETNEIVAEKTKTALDANLTPIVCVGESLEERENNKTENIVGAQINAVIDKIGIESCARIIIAYEPIWAIGTGMTATPEQAQETHAYIRGLLAQKNTKIAEGVRILYGGSVNPENAADLFACEDIDGGLIGGASLNAADFLAICRAG